MKIKEMTQEQLREYNRLKLREWRKKNHKKDLEMHHQEYINSPNKILILFTKCHAKIRRKDSPNLNPIENLNMIGGKK